MSFILDALKKSESERQQQTGAEFASVPTSAAPSRRATWVWAVGALLLVNLAVMLGILLRPAAIEPEVVTVQAPVESIAPAATAAAAGTFADQVAAARETRPDPVAPPPADAAQPVTAPEPAATAIPEPVQGEPAATRAGIPTIDELRLDGRIDLPELRIDIHVYSDDPAERFVFINMVKHRERSVLPEGPAVREIRADGVVLEHRGQVFLLPRQ